MIYGVYSWKKGATECSKVDGLHVKCKDKTIGVLQYCAMK